MNKIETKSLTDRTFWSQYWSTFQPAIVTDVLFSDLFDEFPGPNSTFIEIGGFPGTFSVYFKQFRSYDVTLLDNFLFPSIVRKLESVNSLPEGSISLIECDFLKFNTTIRYDIVFSAGFVEHFDDTNYVLQKHFELLKPGGTLFVSVPNFRGLNGLIQRVFDRAYYDAHNLDAMNTKTLHGICRSLDFARYEIFYYGKPCLWLEKSAKVSWPIRSMVQRLSEKISTIKGNNQFFSPFIVIRGQRN